MTPLEAINRLHAVLARGESDRHRRMEYLQHIVIELQPDEWECMVRELYRAIPWQRSDMYAKELQIYGITIRQIGFKPLALQDDSL